MDDHLAAPDTESSRSAGTSSDASDNAEHTEYLCPICLQPVTHRSYVDPCYHEYCYLCISQWIEFRACCPLCNGKAHSIVQQLSSGKIVKTSVPTEPGKQMPSSQSRRPLRVYGRPEDTQRDAEQGYRKRMAVYSRNLHRAVPETSIRTCISKSPELVRQALAGNRCRAWVRRDIEVILDTTDTAIFEELIVSAIRESGSLDCRVVGPRIEPILGSYTDIFIDELAAFVNSTLPMETYDRYIVYDTANSAK